MLTLARHCQSGAYPMQKVEEFIDRLGWAEFISMLDLPPLVKPIEVKKVKVKGKKPSLSKF